MDGIAPLLAELVAALPTTPAIVVDGRWDVIASNALAQAVSPSLTAGVNLAEATFDNLSAHRTLPQWQDVSARMAGLLKESVSAAGDARSRAEGLRADLAGRSADFARAWNDATVPAEYALEVTMDHPDVGRIEITYELLRVPDADQTLILGHVAPGSLSERRLYELAAHLDPPAR
ncbi:hypothetical protein SAMN05428970_0091 [Agromyces sp. CF514]|uniref:MmyB family transcriptional regulator n=1 Tax=Agromyces sp. CF514 TaxID=1881031 RepID=UPI0008ECA73F|nr:hypothetical protein [Agromyces sp. CF514]SFR66749.1 hypothetical protein SAMN05428970_0091 [Agromyces sp. CF514]